MSEQKTSHITWSLSGGVAVVQFRYSPLRAFEEYDEMRRELDAVAGAEGVRAMILNLHSYEYITSRFLGILAALARKLSDRNHRLVVCRLRTEPARVFTIAGLHKLIPAYPTEKDARAAVG